MASKLKKCNEFLEGAVRLRVRVYVFIHSVNSVFVIFFSET